MKSENSRSLTSELTELTSHQRSNLSDRLREVGYASVSRTLIEEHLSNKPLCPKCSKEHIVHWGSAFRLQRYRCQDCKVTFNTLTGTSFARLRHKDKWLCYSQQLSEGRSIRCSVGTCGVHNTTSFRWRHCFLTESGTHKPAQLKGIVEIDETFFRDSFKGKRYGMTRSAHKRGTPISKRCLCAEQIPVLVCRDRSGGTSDYMLEKDDARHISSALKPVLASDCILCIDSSKAMGAAAREIGITHRLVNLAAGIRIVARVYHVQNVNAYDSRLKCWMHRFHSVASRYLSSYPGWRCILDETKDALTPTDILPAAWDVWRYQQLTWHSLLDKRLLCSVNVKNPKSGRTKLSHMNAAILDVPKLNGLFGCLSKRHPPGASSVG